MAGLQLYPQNLGAIDEDSDYSPVNSPSRLDASLSPHRSPGRATPLSSPGSNYEMSPSITGGSRINRSFSFSHTDFDDQNPDDDLASSAIGNESDYDSDDYDDYEDERNRKKNWINPDVLYQDEFGYWLVKLLRGSTTGRCVKRCVFKMAVVGIACSFSIMIISYLESRIFAFTQYFNTSPYGATLQSLMWVAAVSEAFMSSMSLLFIKYWASCVTNRKLFVQLLRLYMIMQLATVVLGMWMLGVLYTTFEKVDRWQDDLTLAMMFPYYLCTWLFTIPYLLVTVYYTMDISFYMGDLVTDVGVIEEEDPPADRVDLSDVTFNQIILLLVATPVMILVQVADVFIALWFLGCRYFEIRRKRARERAVKLAELRAKKLEEKTRGSSVWTRVVRTLKRRWQRYCCKKKKTLAMLTALDDVPASPYAQKPADGTQKPPENAEQREVQERLARQRAAEQEEARNAKKAAETKARLEAEAVRQREERERQEEVDRAELARKLADEVRDAAPTLDVPRFKAMWASLATSGSFTAKLRMLPSLAGITEHMRNQGFHVVFASAPTSTEVELGVCNIRARPSDKWFMARFVASPTDFSAVMKSEEPESAGSFVKKFSLARVLKIDTSQRAVPSPAKSPQK